MEDTKMDSSGNEHDGRSTAAAEASDGDQAGGDEAAAFRCAYFYYVTPGKETVSDGHFHGTVQAFLMQEADIRPSDKIEDLIPVWAQRAKDRQMTPIGWALGDLRWRRKSYFVVVLDAPGVEFTSEEELVITNGGHTFKDKTLMNFTTANGRKMQAIYCRNLMKKRNGDPWELNEREIFDPLRLEPRASAAKVSPASARPIFTHDDVGTNTGPPQD